MPTAFDPDAYLTRTAKAQNGGAQPPAFDPDAYIESQTLGPREDFVKPGDISGELPASTQAALSFASGREDKKGYIQKQYPEAQFGFTQEAADKEKVPVVRLSKDEPYRYFNQPGFTGADIAAQAGLLPGIAAGLIGGAAGLATANPIVAGGIAGLGEVGRKAIGRGLIGIPEKPVNYTDVADVGLAAGLGGVGQKAANMIFGAPAGKVAREGLEKVAQKVAPLADDALQYVTKEGGEEGAETVAEQMLKKGVAPRSLDEMKEIVSKKSIEAPRAKALEEAEKFLPEMQYPLNQVQKEMVKDPKVYNAYQAVKSDPTSAAGEAINKYEALQRDEIQNHIKSTLNQIAGRETASDPIEAGANAIQKMVGKYQSNKLNLGPVFQRIDNIPVNKEQSTIDLAARVAQEIPTIRNALQVTSKGTTLKPWTQATGVTKPVYQALKDTLETVSNNDLSIRELRAVRESLRKQFSDQMGDLPDVAKLRSAILDHIQDLVTEKVPDVNVREAFKKYAINEKAMERFEGVVGGRLDDFGEAMSKIAPEKALERIFSNSANVKMAKEVFGSDFDSIAADWLRENVEKATMNGTLSAQKLASVFKNKKSILTEAFRDRPQDLAQIKALTQVLGSIPEASPINPSGTAKTSKLIGKAAKAASSPVNALKGLVKYAGEKAEQAQYGRQLNRALGDVPVDTATKKALRGGAAGLIGGKGSGLLREKMQPYTPVEKKK